MSLLGGIVVAWPLTIRAQPSDQMRRIGVLQILADDDPEMVARHAAFEQALDTLGWSVGRNVRIDYRPAGGDANRVRKYAAELVALGPDVIDLRQSQRCAGSAGNAHHSNCFCASHGPSWRGPCREPGASRRQCDRFH